MTEISAVENYISDRLRRELSPQLTYHGPHHTSDVFDAALKIAEYENITDEHELLLLKTAVYFHDLGFIEIYKNHEQLGCEIARKELPGFGYSDEDIERICGLIMATKIPQSPRNKLEEIIADADLDYLGRDDFKPIAHTLFKELGVFFNLQDEREWNKIQLNFLRQHQYFTDYAIKFRQEKKQKHLEEIEQIVEAYVD
jgi:uncharacterized protein